MQVEDEYEDCYDYGYSEKNGVDVEIDEMDTYQTDQIWTDDEVTIQIQSDESFDEEPAKPAARPSASSHLMTLEHEVVRNNFHCWVVRQELDGSCSSFSLNSFNDIFEFLNANIRSPTSQRVVKREATPFHWFDIQGLTCDEIRQMGKMFLLHELTIEDMVCLFYK